MTNDVSNSGYDLGLKPIGDGFNYDEAYQPPMQGSGGYYYTDFQGLDTVYIDSYSYSGGEVIGKDTVAIRYCLIPGCDDVIEENYELKYAATLYTTCFTVQETKIIQVSVEPPVGEVKPIPNVFTPNGDGENDYFELSGSNDPCYDVMEVQIFNRWGKKVFESTEAEFQWNGSNKNDGGECAEGVYFVLIKGSYGSTYNGTTGERIPNPVDQQYTVQLLR
jgi:gliding motility-associated-like protein